MHSPITKWWQPLVLHYCIKKHQSTNFSRFRCPTTLIPHRSGRSCLSSNIPSSSSLPISLNSTQSGEGFIKSSLKTAQEYVGRGVGLLRIENGTDWGGAGRGLVEGSMEEFWRLLQTPLILPDLPNAHLVYLKYLTLEISESESLC